MKKSERLKSVINVAEREENSAAQALLKAQKNHTLASDKLNELVNYFQEYSDRSHLSVGDNMLDLTRLQDNRAFLSKLKDVIEIQRSVVDQCEQQMATARQHWLEKRQKSHSLGRLADSYRDEEHKTRERREQNSSDELNVLRHSWQLRQREAV